MSPADAAPALSRRLLPGWEHLRRHPPVLAPLAVGWVLSAVAALLLEPTVAAAGGSGGTAASSFLAVGAILAPVFHLVRAGLLLLSAWSILVLLGRLPPFRPLFSIFVHGEVIVLLQTLLLPLWLRLAPPPDGPGGLTAPFSLQPLAGDAGPWLTAAAGGVTPVHLIWAAFVYLALRRVLDQPALPSALTVALLWAGRVGLGSLPALMIS